MNNADRFNIAFSCINQIDDLFEWPYKAYETRDDLKKRVMQILDEFTYKIYIKTGVREWTNYNEATTRK